MAKRGKLAYGCKREDGDQVERGFSDDSDEDYKVDEDEEFNESNDEYCSSLVEDDSQESFEDPDEDHEWVAKKSRKVGRARGKPVKKKIGTGYLSTAKRKKIKAKVKEDEDIFSEDFKDDFLDEKPRKKPHLITSEKCGHSHKENTREKDKLAYLDEEEEDCDDDDDDDDDYDADTDCEDDEEFIPFEEVETTSEPVKKQGFKRKKRSKSFKRSGAQKPTGARKKRTKRRKFGRRNSDPSSDSDFEASDATDYEYTISEEEREQIREANEICRRLSPSLRSSRLLETIDEEAPAPVPKRKHPGKKGKQKMVDITSKSVKQVCGICLSEEGKRTVVGALNCCTHYFCFACIMEWSKVESRCPLCKQRFLTISRTVRSDGGHNVRHAVFPVPERDQVYQPSEEELRGYLDPYENVLCTECHQGGDDALMLLCDLCDSPAHTYCLGLGHEVPDGNWYCDGCRPTALASYPTPDHGANNAISVASSPVSTFREPFDLNEAYVPETPLSQQLSGSGHSQSPRNPSSQVAATSPTSGSAAFTLFERRRIQRQIHQLLNNRSRLAERVEDGAAVSGMNLFRQSMRPHQSSARREVSESEFGCRIGHQQQLYPCNGDQQYMEATVSVPSRATFQAPF